ncbi:MAG: hypothetical protein ACRC3B_18320, partial [Bacteroidia bacterium]
SMNNNHIYKEQIRNQALALSCKIKKAVFEGEFYLPLLQKTALTLRLPSVCNTSSKDTDVQ